MEGKCLSDLICSSSLTGIVADRGGRLSLHRRAFVRSAHSLPRFSQKPAGESVWFIINGADFRFYRLLVELMNQFLRLGTYSFLGILRNFNGYSRLDFSFLFV